MLCVIPFQKVVVHFLSVFSGFHSIFQFVKGTEIIGFSFECDLRLPFPASRRPIHAGISACVGGNGVAFGSFQHCHRRTVTQFQIIDDAGRLQTAAAFCFSGLQQGLPYNGFLAAVAPAFPISSPFYIAPLCSSGADRAAVLLRTGAGVNRRFPTVAGRAFPPDLSMGMRCDVCGR